MKGLDLLVINSYAGSILIAADQYRTRYGTRIRGSYEDKGYGVDIQAANFPSENFIPFYAQWPKQDLSSTFVVGHPPCSAFSVQNNSAVCRGPEAAAFQCTRKLLDYAMGNHAAAIAIESVPGALEGARAVHDEYGERYGYDVYRVQESAIAYGLPQWRERVWFYFVRRGLIKTLRLHHKPTFTTLRKFVDRPNPGQPIQQLERRRERVLRHLRDMGIHHSKIKKVFNAEYTGETFPHTAARVFEGLTDRRTYDVREIAKKYGAGTFGSSWMYTLNLDRHTSALIPSCWWATAGRNLYANEYKAIMGFPRSYKFPGKYENRILEFLSRGVCPPIAYWIIDQGVKNLIDAPMTSDEWSIELEPGETADFRVKRSYYEQHKD